MPASIPVVRPQTGVPSAPAEAGPLSTKELMDELTALSGIHPPVTKKQAEKFKHDLEELIHRGPAAVGAIKEFLAKNVDSDFGQVEGGDQLSYSSLRAALFDALKQIGGAEAQGAMLQALQSSAVPAELLDLATDLESQAPGQYRDEILKAAREALEMGAVNQLGTNAELGPAYRILNTYGEAGTAEDAPKHHPDSFYSAIAMANLPDGRGLASLVQMAQNPSPDASGRIVATEMIAQLAGQNDEALETLVQMAQNQQISNRVWTRLAPILAGERYELAPTGGSNGEENGSPPFTMVNAATSVGEINERLGLIDLFLGVVEKGSAAAAALQHERDALASKLVN
jgi:hypothetical protein